MSTVRCGQGQVLLGPHFWLSGCQSHCSSGHLHRAMVSLVCASVLCLKGHQDLGHRWTCTQTSMCALRQTELNPSCTSVFVHTHTCGNISLVHQAQRDQQR
jgi:hypothetical protein